MYDKVCKSCGRRLSEFYNTSLLGCPECYKAFAAELELAVEKVQGDVIHKGKTPKNCGVDHELLREYRKLLEEKERAGLEGRFEDMARIGSEIKSLTDELYRRGLK